MQAIGERVVDQSVLKLVRQVLRAGVMQDGQVRREAAGAAQGGPVSPLLCNVCLHRLDREWGVREHGVLVRFADDLLVMCKSAWQARAAPARLRELLADLGLEPKEAKTRIVHLEEGGPGFDFLGFHHQMVRSRGWQTGRGTLFLARWPADKAMRHARDRIRELTVRSRLLLPPEVVVQDINMFLRGWVAYFRYGHSAARLDKIRDYATLRLAIFIGKRHKRGRRFGLRAVACLSPDRYGLISMSGVAVPPRANKPWREKPHAAGERRR
jgi:RNA-directed DNA polymerase